MTRKLFNTALLFNLLLIFACNGGETKSTDNAAVLGNNDFREKADEFLKTNTEDLNEEEVIKVAQYFSENTNYDLSIPLFRKAIEVNAESVTGRLFLANNLRQIGEYNEAINIYNELVVIDSIEFIVLPERARLYTHLTEFDKAELDIERAKSLQSKYFAVYLADGLLQYAQGRQQEALDLFDVAIELDPGVSSEASLYAGFILLKNNLNYDALENFTKAIDIGKNINVGYAFINRGVCQINLQDTVFACHDWDSAAYYMPEEAKRYKEKYCPN